MQVEKFAIGVLKKFVNDEKAILLLQFIKFCIVGVSNVIINLLVYYLFIYFGASYYTANTFGYCISLLNAYYWNIKWVFSRQNTSGCGSVAKFFCVYIFSYFLTMFLLYVFVDIMEFSKLVVPIINVLITTPINFILNKFWSFKE